MACDAAMRILVKDMVMKCLLMTPLIGLTSLSAFFILQKVTMVSLACELGHTPLLATPVQRWRFFVAHNPRTDDTTCFSPELLQLLTLDHPSLPKLVGDGEGI